ncbi:MAG: tRNA (adenosine(37)-N6)-dimethylallyltransferase MiaA [Myxococcota bacterium]
METSRPRVLVLLGPTASGKTRLALELARALDTDVVSADSVQVYRGLDIASAKPSAAEQAAVRHHGLDLFDPREPSHAGRWLAAVEPAIAELSARGRVPLVTGGTGLYARALLLELSPIPDIAPELRAAVRAETLADPAAAHAELARLDPASAARLAPNDLQRVGRALEVARQSGRPLSAWHADEPLPHATPRPSSCSTRRWPCSRRASPRAPAPCWPRAWSPRWRRCCRAACRPTRPASPRSATARSWPRSPPTRRAARPTSRRWPSA